MSGGADDRGVIELRADADTSSIAAELRSTDARLGRLFAQYQLKVPERFGSGPGIAQALFDFGADVLETARRLGPSSAISLLEAELAALDVPMEGEDQPKSRDGPTKEREQELLATVQAADTRLREMPGSVGREAEQHAEVAHEIKPQAEQKLPEALRAPAEEQAKNSMPSWRRGAVYGLAATVITGVAAVSYHLRAVENATGVISGLSSIELPKPDGAGGSVFQLGFLGEIYRLRDPVPQYVLNIGDATNTGNIYTCSAIRTPSPIIRVDGKTIEPTPRVERPDDLEQRPAPVAAMSLYCSYRSSATVKTVDLKVARRWYDISGWSGGSFSDDQIWSDTKTMNPESWGEPFRSPPKSASSGGKKK